MSYLTEVLTVASGAAGAAAAAWQTVLTFRQSRSVREEVRKLTQDQERRAVQSYDIRELGRYLYDNIGTTRIANYVGNAEVRARVSTALNGVLSFLGTEDTEITRQESDTAAQQANEREVIHALEESQSDANGQTSEMVRALEEITYGEVWNGLARMRRHIEIQLHESDPELTERSSRQSIGRFLTTLRQSGRITDNPEKLLRYAVNVANAGVHGNEVSVGQAQEAWEAAVRGLALLQTPH